MKECTRKDFEDFNASHIYDNLEKLDPIIDGLFNKTSVKRYCFDIPIDEILPEYGSPFFNGNGTLFNLIQIELLAERKGSAEP